MLRTVRKRIRFTPRKGRAVVNSLEATAPAARNNLQSGHCASAQRELSGAFALDHGLESFTNQLRGSGYPGKVPGDAYQIAIHRKGYSRNDTAH
jgi:hypothetical protein